MRQLYSVILEKLKLSKDLKINKKINDYNEVEFDKFIAILKTDILSNIKYTNQDIKNLENAILNSTKFDKQSLLFSLYNENEEHYHNKEISRCLKNKTLPTSSQLISSIGNYNFSFVKSKGVYGIIDMLLLITDLNDKVQFIFNIGIKL